MGIKVILVSRFPKSPGGQLADLVLQCGSNEGPLQVGSVSARMAQLFVLDLLFTEVCDLDPECDRELGACGRSSFLETSVRGTNCFLKKAASGGLTESVMCGIILFASD